MRARTEWTRYYGCIRVFFFLWKNLVLAPACKPVPSARHVSFFVARCCFKSSWPCSKLFEYHSPPQQQQKRPVDNLEISTNTILTIRARKIPCVAELSGDRLLNESRHGPKRTKKKNRHGPKRTKRAINTRPTADARAAGVLNRYYNIVVYE